MLHLIFQFSDYRAISQRIILGDEVIFFENTLFRLHQGSELTDIIKTREATVNFYVLEDDIKCRGLCPKQLILGIKVIDYPQLVRLTEKNKLIQTWN